MSQNSHRNQFNLIQEEEEEEKEEDSKKKQPYN